MPVIAVFFGIVVRMWHDDHPPPHVHVHVQYQGFEALVDIRTGEVTDGRLPRRAAGIVKGWCLQHRKALLRNWQLAQCFAPLERIAGADQDDQDS